MTAEMDQSDKPPREKRVKKSSAAPRAPKRIPLPHLLSDPNAVDPERREKIEKIKKALADGTYHISNEDLADKLIQYLREPKP